MILAISIVKICLSLVVSIDNNQNFKNVGEIRQPIALFANCSISHKKKATFTEESDYLAQNFH